MKNLRAYITEQVPIAPLAMFRVLFGFMMFVGVVRMVAKGWVREFYIDPIVYFPFYGFEWVKPPGETGIWIIVVLMALGALGIMLGLFYRLSAAVFFLAFTYVELIDKTYYLNHYYFVSLVSLAMVFLPAHRYFSIDARRNPLIGRSHIPRWHIGTIRLQLAFVYFFAGIAKLNPAWLLDAMPLKIWLQGQTDLPLLGPLFDLPWVPYLFSWFGAIYDLTIVFFLLMPRTRWWAYAAVIVFHALTGMLFNIGMFPLIMILATLVYFSPQFHEQLIHFIRKIGQVSQKASDYLPLKQGKTKVTTGLAVAIAFFAVQLLLVFRFMFYPGNLYWTEQGYRFSWRVMLVEKAGTAFFYVTDPATKGRIEVNNRDFLTITQEKQMSFQPDMILQFAHFLRDHYKNREIVVRRDTLVIEDPIVTAEVYVRLNNSGSRLLIDPEVNLARIEDSFSHKNWILPYE